MQIADKQQREQALDTSKSFIVQAPAGSGKTSLLIQRYLVLLAQVKKAPEEILAITFTRKAAAEMRTRILAALSATNSPLIANPNRLRIYTIDALCNYLTRQMPILSGFGAQPEIIQGEDLTHCYEQAVQNLLASLEDDPPYQEALATLLLHLDNDYQKVERLLVAMLRNRDQWLPHIIGNSLPNMEIALANVINENILKCMATMPVEFTPPESNDDEFTKWQNIAKSLLTKKYTWRKKLDIEITRNEEFRNNLELILRSPTPKYTNEQHNIINSLIPVLKALVAHLKLVFQEQGAVDYTEIALAALRALGDDESPTDLALKLDYKIQHILVDEFQDTSVTQYRLLEELTAGWEQGDGRTLFLVGDPMQSIYKFREAKVGLFLRAKQYGINNIKLTPLTLTTNFRSQQYLIDWTNITFPNILPTNEDIGSGAIPFISATAVHKNTSKQIVNLYAFTDKDYASEAQQVVKIIKQAKANDPNGTIGVLVRSRTHLDHIIPALNMPYKAVELETLNESMVVQDLFSLTKALLNPLDRIAWLAILRAPWCGLTLADLHILASNDHNQAIWDIILKLPDLSSDGKKRLTHLITVLSHSFKDRYHKSLRQWIEDTWQALDGPHCLTDKSELKEAQTYFNLLAEQNIELNIPLLERKLTTLYAEPNPEADDSLQIMTIHKAKGLEFDTVIIPGLNRKPRKNDNSLLLWMERPSALANTDSDLIMAPINAIDKDHDPIYQHIQHEDKKKNYYETGRLLYVAVTRAKKALHLLACGADKPNKDSLLEQLWPNFSPPEPIKSDIKPITNQDNKLIRLPSNWQFKNLTLPNPPDYTWHWNLPDNTAKNIGTVIHKTLEQYARNRHINSSAIWKQQLIQLGTYNNLSKNLDIIETAINNTLQDPHGQWILDNNHEDAHSEYALTLATKTGIQHLVIDRTFVDNGVRWIIDYKTTISKNINIDQYRDQLEIYAQAMRQIDNRPIRLGIYFPMTQTWHCWLYN